GRRARSPSCGGRCHSWSARSLAWNAVLFKWQKVAFGAFCSGPQMGHAKSVVFAHSLNLERLGLLGLVRMLAAGKHMQLAEHAPSERVLRQHPLDGELDRPLGVLGQQLLQRDRLDAADVAGVVEVDLVGQLAAGDVDLAGIDHNDVIAHVHVRAVGSLVLALEAMGNLGREPSEGLAARIDDEPVAAGVSGVNEYSLHGVSVIGPGAVVGSRQPRRPADPGVKKGREVYSSPPPNAKPPARRPARPPFKGRLMSDNGPNGQDRSPRTPPRPPAGSRRPGPAIPVRSRSRFAPHPWGGPRYRILRGTPSRAFRYRTTHRSRPHACEPRGGDRRPGPVPRSGFCRSLRTDPGVAAGRGTRGIRPSRLVRDTAAGAAVPAESARSA